MKIVVDVFGGDYAPTEIIKGCVDAQKIDKEINVVLVGKKNIIVQELNQLNVNASDFEIIDAPDVITNDDVPTAAIRSKTDSSLVKALKHTKQDPEAVAFVSAGSTGAVLTGALFLIGRIKGILRPALAPLLPTVDDKEVLLIDCGANMDCKPEYLLHFGLMGSSYMKSAGIQDPRVALLSVGVEDKKGNELTKEAFQLIKQAQYLNFKGNMEARDILSGDFDVVVADGFMGNVALKSLEGASNAMFAGIKQALTSNFRSKLGAMLVKPALKTMKKRLDYNEKGGAPFLGVEKLVIKTHGSAKALAVRSSILQAKRIASNNLIDKIKENLDIALSSQTIE